MSFTVFLFMLVLKSIEKKIAAKSLKTLLMVNWQKKYFKHFKISEKKLKNMPEKIYFLKQFGKKCINKKT